MSSIRSRGNKDTELKLIAIFRAHGIKGWRRNQRLHGKPDFVFRKQRLAVFVDGCFWHGCNRHLRMPKSNQIYWQKKIGRNVSRDRRNNKTLKSLGWRVIRVWQHDLKFPDRVVTRIAKVILVTTEALPTSSKQCKTTA
ncbi:MAG TPA: very short patch repair endonuclease [Candidatus Limnocylindria bacterium]|nr:very short patch repair endonuclease [Candidatus Limnocylindria bacterium]